MIAEITIALLVLRLVAEGVEITAEIREIARRAKNGESISDEELMQAGLEVDEAVKQWEDAVKRGQEGLLPPDFVANNDEGE